MIDSATVSVSPPSVAQVSLSLASTAVVALEVSTAVVALEVSTAVVVSEPKQPVVEINGALVIKNDGRAVLEIYTSIALGSNRAIAMTTTGVGYADLLRSGETLGFSKYAADANTMATILFNGELNGFTGLMAGQPIYLGLSGAITQTPPAAGTLQQLGVALSDTKINIQIQPPIFLG